MNKAAILCVAIVASLPACSIVSGWSDLQGGKRESDGGKPSGGDGGPQDGSSGDARLDGGTGATVSCGAALCPANQGCCLEFSGARECTTRQVCEDNGNDFLACTSGISCPVSAPACCFDFSSGASCLAGCGVTQAELCNPAEPKPCSGSKACTAQVAGSPALMSCQ